MATSPARFCPLPLCVLGGRLDISFTPEQFAHGLESWQWASVGTKTPLFTSPFGDVFFRAEDGFFWWLDTIEGSLTRVCTLDISNVETTDFIVSLNLAGQIHEQIRNLPPGTRFSGLTINGQNT